MALIVQKYGGTSVGSIERIEAVAERVAKHHAAGDQLIVVVSAMSGETNRLLGLAGEISNTPDPRELDMLVSTGEQVSMALLAMALHKRGIGAISLKGSQVAIKTDSFHSKHALRILMRHGFTLSSLMARSLLSRGFRASTSRAKQQRSGEVVGHLGRCACSRSKSRRVPNLYRR